MPIYEYRCPRCGHELELMQKLSDPAPDRCPKCNEAGPLERLMSRTSFQLKGGGWYADLYGSKKKADAPSTSGATPAPAGGATSGTPAPASGGGTSSTSSPAPAAPAAPAKPSGGSSGSST